MTARLNIKRLVEPVDGEKLDVEPKWVTKDLSGRQTFQHPDNPDNQFNGKEVEDATVDRTWRIVNGDQVLDDNWMWDSVTFPEALAVEAQFGASFAAFREAIRNGSLTALQLLVLMVMKRNPATAGATTRDVSMPVADIDIPHGDVDVTDAEAPSALPSSGAPNAPENDDSANSDSSTSPTSPSSSGSDPGSGDD